MLKHLLFISFSLGQVQTGGALWGLLLLQVISDSSETERVVHPSSAQSLVCKLE